MFTIYEPKTSTTNPNQIQPRMSQLDLNGFKKRKRGEKVFKFKVFGSRGYPSGFNGSFQENMRALLEFGHVERGLCGAMASWSFQLEASRQPLLHLVLFVVEEPIELSLEFSCKNCRYIGWGNHMICNKSYHFVLPAKDLSNEYGKTSLIELQRESHSLHGVFHSNGFGHLLCLNGSENGSGLVGYQIMEFWDRLCKGLGAREVSLRDSSRKKGMDLRLLHSVAYGRPWFGQWDYFVKHGSYGVNQETYQDAIKTIQNTPLSLMANQLGYGSCQNEIFLTYQALSSHSLITLGDLFHFMLELKSRIPKESSSSYPTIMSDASCRWSPKRVEKAIHVVVEALKRAEFQWVSRQQVREVARAYIGDTGLLDFVLKSLGNHMVGKYLVRRCLNPVTKVLEYCLEDVSRTFRKEGVNVLPFVEGKLRPQHRVCWAQLVKDLLFLYDNILGDHCSKNEIFMASRIILDSKHLVKDYHGETTTNDNNTNKRRIYCKAMLEQDSSSSSSSSSSTTPYHSFLLKSNATFNELRCEVEKTFKETYFSLRNMAWVSITNMAPLGSDPVFKTVKPGGEITVLCTGSEVCSELTVVYCVCGARDDDGERMVSCDLCRVWQHTRCVMIPDHMVVPDIFLCNGCEQDIVRFRCYAMSTFI